MVENQRPLFWHQGLFLQPQHFQLSDQYSQSLLQPYCKFLEPYFWGVARLEIARGALCNFSFELDHAELLFPDGTYSLVPENAIVRARSFEDDWTNRDQPLTVYLGLKKYDNSGDNVTVLPSLDEASAITTRFTTISEPEEVPDLYQSGPSGSVQRLQFVLKIFWESEKEQAGDYLLLPIAEIEMQGAEIVLRADFVPPALTVQGSVPLLKTIKDIRDLLASRSRQLEEYKAQRGIHTAEFGSRDMVFLLALRSLNRYVPLLFHYTEGADVHPWLVYGIIRQLIGELSTFSNIVNVLGEDQAGGTSLDGYDHKALEGCFRTAQAIVVRLLDDITAGPEFVFQMAYDGTYFVVDLPPAVFEGSNRFYLVVETEEDPKLVTEALLGIAKLGTREGLPMLIARALPGVGLEHLPTPPQELPRRANCIYFQIDRHDDQWSQVQKNKNLALYWDAAPEAFDVELMVVGRT